MGGLSYEWRDGSRLTPWMNYCMSLLDAELRRRFGVALIVTSGIRTYQEQVDIFLSRYRLQATGSGPYGDVRWWEGRRYVRYSGLGTVAAPGTSNHEIQGSKGAVDLADTGGPGIGTMVSERSNWLRANAATYGLIPEGFAFKEAWHYAVPNIFQTPPTPNPQPVPPEEEEDDMTNSYVTVGMKKGGNITVNTFDMNTGVEHLFQVGDNAGGEGYARNVALTYGGNRDVPISYITESHFGQIQAKNAERRKELAQS